MIIRKLPQSSDNFLTVLRKALQAAENEYKKRLKKGYASFVSIIPSRKKKVKSRAILFNKVGFVDLKDKKEKNLLLEQYRILSEQANKASENRETFNNFWITLNGAILGGIAYVKDMKIDNPDPKNFFIWVLMIFGFISSIIWMKALGKIAKDIKINNEMVMEMETFLPAKIFITSYHMKGKTNEKGSLSSIEKTIPLLFCIGYIILAILLINYSDII